MTKVTRIIAAVVAVCSASALHAIDWGADNVAVLSTADATETLSGSQALKGVKVTADLPGGVTASDKPAVIHLFAEDCNGYKAGYMEIPDDLTVDGDRMTFTINGTSPLDLAWGKAGKKSSSGSSSGSGSKVKRSTKTGDSANPALWLLLAAGAAGLGTAAVRKRRGKK